VGLVLGTGAGLALALAARPVVLFLAGQDFEPAVPVLQIQAAALPATFLVSVWATGLWAIRGQRLLAIANCVGVATAVTLTAIAARSAGAEGVAVAMLVAEWLLAALYLAALVRQRPGLRPAARVVPKVVLAAALGSVAFLLPAPELVRAACGGVAYTAAIVLLRAMPPEAWRAFAVLRPGARSA
jgi:O-antigen/teichoic acid export membrane protein